MVAQVKTEHPKIDYTPEEYWELEEQSELRNEYMVIKGKPVLQDNRNDTVTNPLLIVEVLSKSTKNYDQGDKFDYYRSIPEFTEYILVDQYSYSVKQFAKAEDSRWWLSEYQNDNDILNFASLDCNIKLSDIYEEIEFI